MERHEFLSFYSNLPLSERHQVILSLKETNGPITWEVAFNEIKADTKLGKLILNKLEELELIPKQKNG